MDRERREREKPPEVMVNRGVVTMEVGVNSKERLCL